MAGNEGYLAAGCDCVQSTLYIMYHVETTYEACVVVIHVVAFCVAVYDVGVRAAALCDRGLWSTNRARRTQLSTRLLAA